MDYDSFISCCVKGAQDLDLPEPSEPHLQELYRSYRALQKFSGTGGSIDFCQTDEVGLGFIFTPGPQKPATQAPTI